MIYFKEMKRISDNHFSQKEFSYSNHNFYQGQVIYSANLSSRLEIRKQLGILQDAFLIGGSCSFIWRKGFDQFMTIASKCRNAEGLYFIWYGKTDASKLSEINYDKEKIG